MTSIKSKFCFLIILLITGLFLQDAVAIVFHPANEPNLVSWKDRPADAVTGRWGENASCIVIAPNYVITTRHQGGGISTPVTIGGITYTIDKIFIAPDRVNPNNPDYDQVDLQLVKLESANLTEYAEIYTQTDEREHSGYAVITGFGVGRDAELKNDGITYGYSWQDDSVKNFHLRNATNNIYKALNNSVFGPDYNIDVLLSQFDEPGSTIYEGAMAEFDSGGGWFIKSSGKWKVAALNFGTEHAGIRQSWFRRPDRPEELSPELIIGVRLSSYADWILNTIENVCMAYPDEDFNGNCVIDSGDLAIFAEQWLKTGCDESNNFCQHADLTRDGLVNLWDFQILASVWMENYQP